ncbi:uncharacterized protein LOC121404464 [Drosophila obscura]|uniref:uncharacterized protein LOC121404464 n=1 Tax=Drosophila obscura TaxID=7282 RepID=UPI001BB2CC5E|nr:uncharacterized protein LOC121404464 [Drosophila obscura]
MRISAAFRTVSTEAILVKTGIPPVELAAMEARTDYMERKVAITQEDDRAARSRARSICLDRWQVLSEHGCFKSYLHRFGHEKDELCTSCGVEENAEHVLTTCVRFSESRGRAEGTLGVPITVEAWFQLYWTAICSLATEIAKELRRLESIRNEQP